MVEASILLLVLPFAYVALKWGKASPETVFIVSFAVEFLTQVVRVFLVMPKIKMRVKDYFMKIYAPICLVSVPVGLYAFSYPVENTFVSFFISSVLAGVVIIISCWMLGVKRHERAVILEKVSTVVHNKFKSK